VNLTHTHTLTQSPGLTMKVNTVEYAFKSACRLSSDGKSGSYIAQSFYKEQKNGGDAAESRELEGRRIKERYEIEICLI